MKESLSSSTRALLKAARRDGASVAARTKIWGAVSGATGVAAALDGASLTSATSGSGGAASSIAVTSTGKLLVAGALTGCALTLGIALTLARVVPGYGFSAGRSEIARGAAVTDPSRRPADTVDSAWTEEDSIRELERDEPPPIPLSLGATRLSGDGTWGSGATATGVVPGARVASPGRVARGAKSLVSAGGRASDSDAPASSGAEVRSSFEDSLSRESALILEARGALRRGDPTGALASLEAARRVGSNKLEPEELSVRARILRALGRNADAAEAEGQLKLRYPDQALAR